MIRTNFVFVRNCHLQFWDILCHKIVKYLFLSIRRVINDLYLNLGKVSVKTFLGYLCKLSKSKIESAKMSSGKSEREQMGVCIAQVQSHFSACFLPQFAVKSHFSAAFCPDFAVTDETVSAFIPPICALLKTNKTLTFSFPFMIFCCWKFGYVHKS